jgi:hypothetical protein
VGQVIEVIVAVIVVGIMVSVAPSGFRDGSKLTARVFGRDVFGRKSPKSNDGDADSQN